MYVIKHVSRAFLTKIVWNVLNSPVLLHRDFFIVLDLRLTKIGRTPWGELPFVFYRGSLLFWLNLFLILNVYKTQYLYQGKPFFRFCLLIDRVLAPIINRIGLIRCILTVRCVIINSSCLERIWFCRIFASWFFHSIRFKVNKRLVGHREVSYLSSFIGVCLFVLLSDLFPFDSFASNLYFISNSRLSPFKFLALWNKNATFAT